MANVPRGPHLDAHDLAIGKTAQVNHAVQHGVLDSYPRVPATIRLPDGRGPIAVGAFRLMGYQNIQYTATRVGPPESPGFVNVVNFSNREAVNRAVGYQLAGAVGAGLVNRRNERKAREMSGGRWSEVSRGEIHVGGFGVLLRVPPQNSAIHWNQILNAELVGPGRLKVELSYSSGPREEILESVFAELVFVLWAHSEFPEHGQLQGRTWIPPGWADRVRAAGRELPSGSY